MARLTTVGFELNSATAGVEADLVGSGVSISSTTVRSGAYAGRITSPTTLAFNGFEFRHGDSSTVAVRYFRAYVYVHALPNATTVIMSNITALGSNVGVQMDTAGKISLYGVGVGTQSAALSVDTWYRIEFYFDTTPASGSQLAELRLDGTSIETVTNAVIGSTSGKPYGFRVGINCFTGGTCTSADIFFDDIAINDGATGTGQTSWPGAGSVVYLFPTGAGDNTQWTIAGSSPAATNYQGVNEKPPDDGVTYNKRTTSGSKVDDFTVTSPATAGIGASDPISLVHVQGRFGSTSNSAAAGRRIWTRVKSAASGTVHRPAGIGVQATTSGAAVIIPVNTTTWATGAVDSNGISNPRLVSYVDPTTAAAWTRDGTNSLSNMQIGYENETSSTNEIRTTAVWAIVEYVPNTTSNISDGDTGAGTEAATVAATLTDGDTGSATDAEAAAVTVTDPETGAAVETAAVAATLTDGDTAAAVDGGESIAATLTDDDTGTAVDTESVLAFIPLTDDDTGTGVDDNESILALLVFDDAATSAEAATLTVDVSDGDGGIADDGGTEVPTTISAVLVVKKHIIDNPAGIRMSHARATFPSLYPAGGILFNGGLAGLDYLTFVQCLPRNSGYNIQWKDNLLIVRLPDGTEVPDGTDLHDLDADIIAYQLESPTWD